MEEFQAVLITVTSNLYIQVLMWSAGILSIAFMILYVRFQYATHLVQKRLKSLHSLEASERLASFHKWIRSAKVPFEVKKCWEEFHVATKKGKVAPDVYEYFTEAKLVHKYGQRKVVESLPAIFLSLGILGTFYGIAKGVKNIDPNSSAEQLSAGVSSLMSGMEIAFHSSIAGIVLSIAFQFIDRLWLYKMLINSFYQLRSNLDEAFPVQTEVDLIHELLEHQKKEKEEMKSQLQHLFKSFSENVLEFAEHSIIPNLVITNNHLEQQTNQQDKANQYFKEGFWAEYKSIQKENTAQWMYELKDTINEQIERQTKRLIGKQAEIHRETMRKNEKVVDGLQQNLTSIKEETLPTLFSTVNQLIERVIRESESRYTFIKEEMPVKINELLENNLTSHHVHVEKHMENQTRQLGDIQTYFDQKMIEKMTSSLSSVVVQEVHPYLNSSSSMLKAQVQKMDEMKDVIRTELTRTISESMTSIVKKELKPSLEKSEELLQSQNKELKQTHAFLSSQFVGQLQSGLANVMKEGLDPHLERSNQILSEVVHQTTEIVTDRLDEMVHYFVEQLQEETGDHLRELGTVVNKSVEWQERVYGELDALVYNLSQSAQRQEKISVNTTNLTEKFTHFTQTINEHQSQFIDSAKALSDVQQQSEKTQIIFNQLIKTLTEERSSFDTQFNQKIRHFIQTIDDLAQQGNILLAVQQQMKDVIGGVTSTTNALNDFVSSNESLSITLQTQAKETVETFSNIQSVFNDVTKQTDKHERIYRQFENTVQKLFDERTKLEKTKEYELYLLKDQLKQMDERSRQLKVFWDNHALQLKENQSFNQELATNLKQSMRQFNHNMQNGLQRANNEVNGKLSSAVSYLHRGAVSLRHVIDELDTDVKGISSSMKALKQSINEAATLKE